MARKSRSRARRSTSSTSSKPSFNYQCYPFSHINKSHCEDGNRIIMPASALDELMSMREIHYPMTFKIINPFLKKFTHCGVLEFSGEEGCVYLPNWMRDGLSLQQGQFVSIEYNELPKGQSLKILPHCTEFIMNHWDMKEVMERILKDFACVTVGDTVMVNHDSQSYYIDIVEAKPHNAVCLFETDCELEILKPLDYEQPPEQIKTEEGATELEEFEADFAKFKPFTGVSRKLDENITTHTTSVAKIDSNSLNEMSKLDAVICSQNYDGTTVSGQGDINDVGRKNEVQKFQPFTGRKYTLSGS